MEDHDMRPGDMNIQVVRSIPFWPTVIGTLTVMFTCGGLYVNYINMAAQITDIKSITLSQSGKLNDLKAEQIKQGVQLDNFNNRVSRTENQVEEIRKDVWKLQQAKSR